MCYAVFHTNSKKDPLITNTTHYISEQFAVKMTFYSSKNLPVSYLLRHSISAESSLTKLSGTLNHHKIIKNLLIVKAKMSLRKFIK